MAAAPAEIEERARGYRLPPVAWPPGWPPNTLRAMRAVMWAGTFGAGEAYARAAFRAAFADGRDLADDATLQHVARAVGLPAEDLPGALADPAIKDALRASTQEAIDLGVRGVPTVATADGRLVFGDDRLAEAA